MNFLGNSNGLVSNIYYYFWVKSDDLDPESFKVAIPDTIIFVGGLPQSWYFTSKSGLILLRKQENKEPQHILDIFLKNMGKSQIAAVFIQQVKEEKDMSYMLKKQRKQGIRYCEVKEDIALMYLDGKGLREFLEDPDRPKHGILQKFIEPYGNQENMIQAIWSPTLCVLSKRVNHHPINDLIYDAQERCSTFGSPEVFSKTVPLNGQEISQKIRSQIGLIIGKIKAVTFEKDSISRAVFYFKADQNNKIYFMYCSSIRTETEIVSEDVKPMLNPNGHHNNTPLAIGDNYQIASGVKNVTTTNAFKPQRLFKNLICYDCNKRCQQSDLYDINYQMIINFHDNLLTKRNEPKAKVEINRGLVRQTMVKFPIKNPPVLLTRIYNKSDTPHSRQDSSNQKNRNQQSASVVVGSTDILIPPLLRKIYPKLDNQNYEQLKNNDMFRIKSIKVCEQCFIKYTSANPEITGAQYKINEQHSKSKIKTKLQIGFKDVLKKLEEKLLIQDQSHQKSASISASVSRSHNSSIIGSFRFKPSQYTARNTSSRKSQSNQTYSTNITNLLSKHLNSTQSKHISVPGIRAPYQGARLQSARLQHIANFDDSLNAIEKCCVTLRSQNYSEFL